MIFQRYFINDTFYKPQGPVVLLIGGEGPANPAWMVTAMPLEVARKLNGYLLQLEHRFYGKSHPTEWVSSHISCFITLSLPLCHLSLYTFLKWVVVNLKHSTAMWNSQVCSMVNHHTIIPYLFPYFKKKKIYFSSCNR